MVFQERNFLFRDNVRQFFGGEAGSLPGFAARVAGSGDLFAPARKPYKSLNVISSPEGRTMVDALVSVRAQPQTLNPKL